MSSAFDRSPPAPTSATASQYGTTSPASLCPFVIQSASSPCSVIPVVVMPSGSRMRSRTSAS